MSSDQAWIQRMQRAHVLDVASALGLQTMPARGASGGSVIGCPSCGAERRHASRRDRRGALGVRHDGTGFQCMECQITGDGIDLVAYATRGKRYRELSDVARQEVREWCAQYTGAELGQPSEQQHAAPPPPAPVSYPPEEELRVFWDSCQYLTLDAELSDYLESRRVYAGAVATFDVVRVLPMGIEVPAWAARWQRSGHRLIVPLYDQRGLMRSCLARTSDPNAQIKSLAPSGYSRAGLVMADGFARWLLATAQRPDWWPTRQELRIVIAEGEIDFLYCVRQWSDAAEFAPATLGIVSGSWTDEIAARIPDCTTVVIATDNDEAGERYAATIAQSLQLRDIALERWEARA